jgi:hypothetical protein
MLFLIARDRAVQTLFNFLEALIISSVIVYATYGLLVVAMRSLWWVVRFLFWAIACAAFGVTLLLVHPFWWMVGVVARLGDRAQTVRLSRAGSATGHEAKSVAAPHVRRPLFPDVAISIRDASEALFAYQQQVFCARSEMRAAAARTLEIIAQTRALIAQVDAAAAGNDGGYAASGRH